MPLTMIESFEEFAERHGGNGVEMDNRILFPDGAATDSADRIRWEPPPDPIRCLQKVYAYWEARVLEAESNFNKTKQAFVEQGSFHSLCPHNCPPPRQDAPEILRRLKSAVTACRRNLAKIARQLEDTPEAQRRRRNAELQAEQKAEESDLVHAIMNVNI